MVCVVVMLVDNDALLPSYRISLRNKLVESGWHKIIAKIKQWPQDEFRDLHNRIDRYQKLAEVDLLDFKEGRHWAKDLNLEDLQNPYVVYSRLLSMVEDPALAGTRGSGKDHFTSILRNLLMVMGSMDEPGQKCVLMYSFTVILMVYSSCNIYLDVTFYTSLTT